MFYVRFVWLSTLRMTQGEGISEHTLLSPPTRLLVWVHAEPEDTRGRCWAGRRDPSREGVRAAHPEFSVLSASPHSCFCKSCLSILEPVQPGNVPSSTESHFVWPPL